MLRFIHYYLKRIFKLYLINAFSIDYNFIRAFKINILYLIQIYLVINN